MDNTKKALKVIAALVVVFTLSSFSTLINKTQKAQVVSVSTSVFSVFNRNETVLRAQTILKDLGMYSGRLSGLFGFKTRNALLMYQTSIQIPQTGILDLLTQASLFAPPSPPIEYVIVDNTAYGNQFLSEWLFFTFHSGGGEEVELEGLLNDEASEVLYNGYSSRTDNSLVVDSKEYRILNISQNNLNDHVNQNVLITGYVFDNELDGNRQILVVNHTTETISELEYSFVNYTQDGNDYLRDFVSNKYNQPGQYVSISGEFLIQPDYMSYNNSSFPTRVQLTANGYKYAVENISFANLEEIGEINVTVRGALLEGNNDQGLPTIVVNYVSEDDGFVVVGYTTEGNSDLNNWILDVYREEGVYSRIVGALEDTGQAVRYAPGGNKTSIVMEAEDGERYSVENISGDDLDEFVGQDVVIRGFILENLNSVGLRTIVINHIE